MVRIAINEDSRVLAEMAVQMWDSHTVDELEAEFVETLNDKQSAFFIKYINDLPVGFAQRLFLHQSGQKQHKELRKELLRHNTLPK